MRIHSLQHVPFEDIGSLAEDIQTQNHSLTTTHWYRGDSAPNLNSFDILIIMGGPMGVYDEAMHPWLATEKVFLSAAIAANKKILGICLGAQLLACVLDAKVTQNIHREIGWFPLLISTDAIHHPIAKILATCDEVFHWHGDTFALPAQAQLLASSHACVHQAYVIGNQIYGLQFHLETTKSSAQALITHCSDDLDNSIYVQSAEEILQNPLRFSAINALMSQIFKLLQT